MWAGSIQNRSLWLVCLPRVLRNLIEVGPAPCSRLPFPWGSTVLPFYRGGLLVKGSEHLPTGQKCLDSHFLCVPQSPYTPGMEANSTGFNSLLLTFPITSLKEHLISLLPEKFRDRRTTFLPSLFTSCLPSFLTENWSLLNWKLVFNSSYYVSNM